MKRILYLRKFLLLAATASIAFAVKARGQERSGLETVAEFGKHMAIGLSVNTANRIFVSFPNYDGAGKYALAEIIDGDLFAYPNKQWNTKNDMEPDHFLRIQDLYVDDEDNLWVLDSKPAPGGDIFKTGEQKQRSGLFQLVKINTKTNKIEKTFDFPDLDKSVSALNDVRVDPRKQVAYLSDPGQVAIVVLDLESGKSRTVLKKSPYTTADDIVLKYSGVEMKDKNGHPFSSHVNGIALTHDGKYLYFKPINKEALFRIDTRFLTDSSLSVEELTSKVENMGKVGITHGLIADKAGNIYLTTSEDYSVSYLTPGGKLKTLVKDSRLLWPDSMGIGGDGYLYVSCSQLQLLPNWNNGEDKTQYPYRTYKVRLDE